MRALSLVKPGSVFDNPLNRIAATIKNPENNEICIKVSMCGVCRTDLHIVEGDLSLPKLPIIPGHQIVGTIDSMGENVTDFSEGDRVGVPWMSSTCGTCDYCQNGNENLCDNVSFTGLNIDGGYSEYVTVHSQFVYHLPKSMTDEQVSPLLCAGIIGYRTLKQSRIKPGQKLGLYGFGASAHITIQIAKYWNCNVYVYTRSEEHQKHAEELGADWVGQAEDNPGVEMDASIIFAPAGELMIEALKRIKKGGTVASAGIHMTDIPQFPYKHLYGERILTSAANATRKDGSDLLSLAEQIPISTETVMYQLEDANRALQDLKQSKFNGAAVLKIS